VVITIDSKPLLKKKFWSFALNI